MSYLRDFCGVGSRPYPLDHECRLQILHILLDRQMSISDLAKSLGIARAIISQVISRRRLSPKTEQRIAEYLGKPVDYLFPTRTPEEIALMRQAETAGKEAA